MSTPTVRRIKPHGGGGGAKITAPLSKTLSPLSAGKENSNPTIRRSSAAAPIQKPAVPHMPRITRSNSVMPKGRSSSPFEFTRALSDMRKNQGFGPRVTESGKLERSASSGRRSVSRDRVFDRCQPKVGSSRDLDVKSVERVGKVNSGVKEKNVILKDLGRIEVGLEKSGKFCKENERVFSMSHQKNGFFRDSNVKLGGRVDKMNTGVKEREGLEKSGDNYKKGDAGLKGSADLASRMLGRSQPKNGSLKDSNVKLAERVEKLNENIGRVQLGTEKSEEICKNNESGIRGSDDLLIGGLKDRKSIACSERLKPKGMVEEKVNGRSVNKYPSKLHEKLAFLEGKVKRIASDIKRTKEMLDMNNPDSSKVILSDIQEKISGIEKAMGNVTNSNKQVIILEKDETNEKVMRNEKAIRDVIICNEQNNVLEDAERKELKNVKSSDKGLNSSKQINVLENVGTKEKILESVVNDDEPNNVMENFERKKVEDVTSSVKGLNSEELEARLFPHHKLLRDRTSSKVSSTSNEKFDHEMYVEKKLSSHTDGASLVKDQNRVTVRGENVGSEFCEVQETDGTALSKSQESISVVGKDGNNIILTTDETLDDFDEQQIKSEMIIDEEMEDGCMFQFTEIGHKTATGGWFVAEGEAALLTHDDGSCTYFDIANSEVKSEYKPPVGISPNMWRDCWIVRAPGADGSSGRYIVAASAGNTLESGFCSWDFYIKDIRAFHIEDGTTNTTRTALAPLPNNPSYRRNSFSSIIASENRQWWYRPCGPLIASTATNQKGVSIYDIRDGEHIMKWEVQKPVLSMDYSSPLQWRNRGKVVIAETESVSLWDVTSQTPQALQSVPTSGRRVYALHVNNTDAEFGGGVRQRVSSSEAEGNDGVFCTADSINVLDFRHPSGIGLKISKIGINTQSVFSRGDSIFLGCTNARTAGKVQPCSQIQHFSLRKQKLLNTYSFPDSNAHPHYTAITQVWGNSDFVMGVCGLGLFVFDALKDDGVHSLSTECCGMQNVRETIGPDDLYSPSFDYLSSRVLLISRDRPALWRYLS